MKGHWPRSWLLVPILAFGAFAANSDGPSGSELEKGKAKRRSEMLSRALSHTEADKEYLLGQATSAPDEPARRLAELLLAEWDLPPSSEQLQTPRSAWRPALDLSGLDPARMQVRSPATLLEGEVSSEGQLSKWKMIRGTGSRALDAACAEALSKSLFRPAVAGRTYVAAKMVLECRFDPL